MGYIPLIILCYIWLVAGRADPGDLFQNLPIIRWFTYVLIPLLLQMAILIVAVRGKYRKTVVDRAVFLLLLLMLFSTFLNGAPWIDFFYGMGVYLRYPLLFMLFCNIPSSITKARGFTIAFSILFVLVALEAIFNFVVFDKYQDNTFFSLGVRWGTGNAGIIFAAAVSLVVAHALVKGFRYFHTLLLALILVAASIASIRTTLVFSGLIALTVFAVQKQWIAARGLAVASVLFTLSILAAALLDWHAILAPFPFLSEIDPGYRMEYIREVIRQISDTGNLLLGAGPRSMNPGTVQSAGSLYSYFLINREWVVELGDNQYVKGFAELGVAGMIVYWYMLYCVLSVAWKNWIFLRESLFNFYWLKIVNLAFFGIWIFYAGFGLFSNDLWRVDASSLVFWFYGAVIAFDLRRNRSTYRSVPESGVILKPLN